MDNGGAVPGSGDAAVQAAEERAKLTRHLNLPQFTDLPIPADTANLREGPNLNDALLALLPLVGVWRGEGEVVYPTLDKTHKFGQQITFAHDGRPFLSYEARAWLLDDDGNVIRPAAREVGWWRVQADDTIELLLAHNTGIVEIFYGKPRTQTSWELTTDAVVRTASAKEVNGAKRLYGLVNNGDLAYVEERAMVGQDLQPHTSAYLTRVVG
ncbi:FABP family protein [Kibdelosporangium philippinense]|uniref:Peroxynitrite isomerase n=1 Tax=Kibdelosporangium philippinense TaxID=211113 RepID=A0ABS8ZC10_9PSEU|nr:FABP family protein [Kibdelosporangium philippinense]MCE7005400.1 FABP family protein [Kibdelosporangium philippinense]